MNAMLRPEADPIASIRDSVSAHCVRLGLRQQELETCVATAVRAFMRGSSTAWAITEAKTDADAIHRSRMRFAPLVAAGKAPTLEDRILAVMRNQNAVDVQFVVEALKLRAGRLAEVARVLRRLALGHQLIRHDIDGGTLYSLPAKSSRKADKWRQRGRM